mgnify:FL=1
MARSLLKRISSLFGKDRDETTTVSAVAPVQVTTAPRVIPEAEHQIPRKYLDDNAMKVVYRILDGGYEGYLVGGCIRDLLLGEKPKDFDVATSASPEEAHDLFRRSRLIGRRFKLLHVRFGREIIEVATFRASHDSHPANTDGEHGRQNESGMITRDNVYGSIDEDAARRDFTCNALYYCVKDHSIHDFANGYQDIQDGIIRMIGDPEARYRVDPVRMLRAARFAGKLGFEIEANTAAPIQTLSPLLKSIAPARLFDESLKLLQSGYAEAAYARLQEYNLFEPLFPQTQKALESEQSELVETLLLNALRNTDRRLAQRKSVTPAFLFAALLWYPVQQRMQQLMKEQKMPPLPALHEAANQVLSQQVKSTAIPRRFSTPIREIWEMQIRLPRRDGKRAERLMEQPRFRAAYDLLLLRENSGEDLGGLSRWWTEYQSANEDKRGRMSRETGNGQKPRRRRRKKPSNKPNGSTTDG